jgi:NADP-dependent 3-hydroxy acid dehydrogenase YdfG
VTVASKGIGLAVTRVLTDEGVLVVAGARQGTPELAALADTGVAQAVDVDLSTSTGLADLVAAALERCRIDILVNNVGAATTRVGGFLGVTDDEWL